jgi:hypothetical protein
MSDPVCICGHAVVWHGGDQDQLWPCLHCDCEDFSENLSEALFEVEDE